MLKFVFFYLLILFPGLVFAEVTAPDSTIENEANTSETCHPAPSETETKELMQTIGLCSPMVLAAGASMFQKAAPAAASAMARAAAGKVGARIVMSANIIGGALTAFEIFKLFGAGAASIESCRVHEIEYKKYIIEQVNRRGEQIAAALKNAGFELTPRDLRRLKFPPAYSEPQRLLHMMCGEMVLLAEQMKIRQNRVYGDHVNGTMRVVPFPEENERKLTEGDLSLIDEFRQSLACLPAREYVQGVCAIGNFVMFARPLPTTGQQPSRLRAVATDEIDSRYQDFVPSHLLRSHELKRLIAHLEARGLSTTDIREALRKSRRSCR